MKRFLIVATAAAVAAVVVLIVFTRPPAHLVLAPSWSDGTIAGLLHIHTVRSDGRGTPDEIAAAAARAGLKFIVFTDHGDATRTPDPPAYRSGVLCLDGVEISTRGGHYVAIGMPASPYPLGGDPRDVVEDVKRLGGFGIVAHPDSPKPELQWHAWDAPIDAIEVINPDTSWRRWWSQPGWYGKWRLATAIVNYPFRAPETLTSLLSGTSSYYLPASTLDRRVVAVAGADAHAKIAPRSADPGDNRWALPLPGYDASFRMMSVHVRAGAALSGDAVADQAVLLQALRAGHVYIAIDGVATPPAFEFSAENDQGSAREGDELRAGGPLTLNVRSDAPPSFTTMIFGPSGALSTDHRGQDVTMRLPGAPGAYWAAIASTTWPTMPWILSNPIYVRGAEARAPTPAPSPPTATSRTPIFDESIGKGWQVEHDATSQATLDVVPGATGASLRLRYQLGAGTSSQQFVALTCDRPEGMLPGRRLTFTARSAQPMRVWVQLRGPDGRRWERSAFVDASEQERLVDFAELTPVGEGGAALPPWPQVRTVLFVIDASNAKPGSSGEIWISHAALADATSAR